MTSDKPDFIVSWLQPDFGQLGRPSEAVARSLVSKGLARTVAYVEPVEIADGTAPSLSVSNRDGVHVYQVLGRPADALVVGKAVVETSGLNDPIFLNFGVGEVNWWFFHAFAPWASATALVAHDLLHLWPGMPTEVSERSRRARLALARASDAVLGLSQGSISDIANAVYVGHGCDFGLEAQGPLPAEPEDLAAIPHPRALYFGALSVRIDARALKALADSGTHVVLLGFAPTPEVARLIETHPRVHFLGPRSPETSPPYLRHCDVGIVPHTDEPFTWSMEPHKVYNYSAAGLRTVLLNCACPPAFQDMVLTSTTPEEFVAAVHRALDEPPLRSDEVDFAKAQTWGKVARAMTENMARVVAERLPASPELVGQP